MADESKNAEFNIGGKAWFYWIIPAAIGFGGAYVVDHYVWDADKWDDLFENWFATSTGVGQPVAPSAEIRTPAVTQPVAAPVAPEATPAPACPPEVKEPPVAPEPKPAPAPVEQKPVAKVMPKPEPVVVPPPIEVPPPVEAPPPHPQPAPPDTVVDDCPEDGTLFDGLENGVYEADRTIEVPDHRGHMRLVPLHLVIADSPADAMRIGWSDNQATHAFTQMFYRDADGCLHNVGCYYPDWADSQMDSLNPQKRPGESSVWDPAVDDADNDGYHDKDESRIPPRGEGKDAVVGAGMLEAEYRRSGITALTRIK